MCNMSEHVVFGSPAVESPPDLVLGLGLGHQIVLGLGLGHQIVVT